jgi:hypothetical protein
MGRDDIDQNKPRLAVTEEMYRYMDENSQGICLRCRHTADGCEPDARRYNCEACEDETGKRSPTVYGASELLVMGVLDITEDDDRVTVVL